MQQQLNGRRILVAGASSGMGRAVAVDAAAAGARVVAFARRADALAEVADEIKAAGGEAVTVVGDATDPQAAEAAVGAAVERFGGLDIGVNSVGVNISKRALSELTREGWRELMTTNLDAAFTLTQAMLPALRADGGGLLLHISSVAAKRPDASGVGYQASKAGVSALAHATMEEERANGVRVSVIYPGLTHTDLVYKRPTPPSEEDLARALKPADVAQMCLAVMAMPEHAHVPEVVLVPSR